VLVLDHRNLAAAADTSRMFDREAAAAGETTLVRVLSTVTKQIEWLLEQTSTSTSTSTRCVLE
jgi:hypothetical protein